MLGIRLEFAQFGDFDSFSVCRSVTPIDPLNLPIPIATGLTTMYYFDSNVLSVLDRDLYYRVIAHRGAESIVSDEMVTYINSFSAPHNVVVTFNSANTGLNLTWDVDGAPTEQKYYCSETPFTAETKPPPKVILTGDVRAYIDTDIEVVKTYYVAVSSVKNSVEKLSEIRQVTTTIGYRYYRIYITANNGDAYTGLQEIELAMSAGGADVTTASTVANQSSYYSRTPSQAQKLVDNNFTDSVNNCWVSETGISAPHWVYFDLIEAQNIKELRMWPQNNPSIVNRSPKDFVIQGSDDAVNWTYIKAFTNVTGWTAGVANIFNLVISDVT